MKETEKQITIRQHFVPQFYLRAFTNGDGKLHVLDVPNVRRGTPRSPSSVCKDDFFYGEETGKPDEISQHIEEYLSTAVENPLSAQLPDILFAIRENRQITDSEKYTIAVLMNNVWTRGPAMRSQINKMSEQAIRKINELKYSNPSIDKELQDAAAEMGDQLSSQDIDVIKDTILNNEYDIGFSNAQHLKSMLDQEHIDGCTNLFFGQDWIVYVNKTHRKFVTSSNPLIVLHPKRVGFWGASFLERTHIISLAPDILVETRYPYKMSGKKIKRKTLFVGDEQKVDELNLKIASYAQYVYGSRPEEVDRILSFIKSAHLAGVRHLLNNLEQ